jgi:hypothetical protein
MLLSDKRKYDILKTQLEYWKNYTPINNMGKLARQKRIDYITEELEDIRNKTSLKVNDILKSIYGKIL